jgi:hypothetical protein
MLSHLPVSIEAHNVLGILALVKLETFWIYGGYLTMPYITETTPVEVHLLAKPTTVDTVRCASNKFTLITKQEGNQRRNFFRLAPSWECNS